MKIKTDFVTNSSSTSFIVAAPKDFNLEVEIKTNINLEKYISERLTTKEDVCKYYGYVDDYGNERENFEKALKAIEEGKEVIILSVASDGGDSIENFLLETGIDNLNFPKEIEIIRGEGGY